MADEDRNIIRRLNPETFRDPQESPERPRIAGRECRGNRRHLEPVQSLVWTPDGNRLIAGGFQRIVRISFANDVMPQLSAAGCAVGSCHAKPEGQNNFSLSVFGYDLRRDYYEIVRENRGRRIFPAAPEESLLLKKATGAIPHEGGKVIDPGGEAYRILSAWIRQGAPFDHPGEATLESVGISPGDRIY